MQQTKPKTVLYVLGAIVVIIILFLLSKAFGGSNPVPQTATSTPAVEGESAFETTYICDAGNTIGATFTGEIADLSLSNGENLTLNQVDSTSGARFENQDGTTAFTVLGPNVSLIEQGATVFTNCIEPKG